MRRHQLAGLAVILVLLGGFGGWMAVASISGAVIAQARVVVETSPKKVQHIEGGVVAEILVRDGAHVEAGQMLLRLDQTETRANLGIVMVQLDELMARQARLEAERDAAAQITFPGEITGRLDDPQVRTAHDGQMHVFAARRAARDGEQAQLGYKIGQLEEEIAGLIAQQQSKERQLALINAELASLRGLQAQGLVTLNRMLTLEREAARLEGERGELVAQIAAKRGEIGETRLRVIQIDKNQGAEVVADLRETQTKIAELREKRAAAEMRLQRTELRAPRSGTVHQLSVHTVGGIVAGGDTVMLIVPDHDRLIFEAQVSPSEIDQVYLGQKAAIRLHAFDPGQAPELKGEVSLISADIISDQQARSQYYLVRIVIDGAELAKLDGRAFIPGMMADAFIETQPRTVLRYLLKPVEERLAHVFRER